MGPREASRRVVFNLAGGVNSKREGSNICPGSGSMTVMSEERWLAGPTLSYADLSLFQLIEGLQYAFPKAMDRVRPDCGRVSLHSERVGALPRIAVYLASERRLAFNENGVFRHYEELDG